MSKTTNPEATFSILDRIAERRGDRTMISQTMGRLSAAYVNSTRDRLLEEEFEEFLDEILATSNGRRKEGGCFFVTGESGAGKTHAIRRLLKQSPTLQPAEHDGLVFDPCVSVKAPNPCTLQRLGLRIAHKIGYPIKLDTAENRVWTMLLEQFRIRQILVVHVDEAQHLVRTMKSDVERQALANTLKDVLQNDEWPVSFILSGIPIANMIGSTDAQIARRSRFFMLPSLDMNQDADRRIGERIILELAQKRAELDCSHLLEGDLVERIAHAGNDQLGRMAQIVAAATHKALLRGAASLELEDFVNAYRSRSHSRGIDGANPFLVANFKTLEKGTFLIEEDRDA